MPFMTFENLPPAEQIRYCRDKLARIDELETQVRSMPSTQQNRETLRDLATARGEYTKALKRLENPSLWQRTNRWVNEWAAEDRAKEAVRKRRRGCTSCNGTGQVVGAGNWFESCRSCNGTGEYREYL
jgi:DnaJ-class molecular chaperone